MRKRVAIAGHSDEGLSLIPLLEANPDVDVCALVTSDKPAALAGLRRIEEGLDARYADRITDDLAGVLRTTGLVAIVTADPPPLIADRLPEASDRGIQVASPLIAKLLYAFGPVDATRKPDLLQTLGEILESYNLTIDREALLERVVQIAVGSTGADRGSLLLWDEESQSLRMRAAIGIERELLRKIRLERGEGIAGRAFAERRAILLRGKADPRDFAITWEREAACAIVAPLLHGDRCLGVLSVTHQQQREAFGNEDLEFLEQLARLDARILARADEYQELVAESSRLKAESDVRQRLAGDEPLVERLRSICRWLADELDGIAQLWLTDSSGESLQLQASSAQRDPFSSPPRIGIGSGVLGWVATSGFPLLLEQTAGGAEIHFAALPLVDGDRLLGVLSFEAAHTDRVPRAFELRLRASTHALAEELANALEQLHTHTRATQLQAITEVSARMAASGDLAELYRAITNSAAMVLEAEHALLRLRDDATGRLQIRSYFGSADPETQTPLFELEGSVASEALQSALPVCLANLDEERRGRGADLGVDDILAHPLRRAGRVVGSLSVLGRASSDPFSGVHFQSGDLDLLARLAEHAQRALVVLQERDRERHNRRFDALTGLPNALLLRVRLDEEIARSGGRGRSFALVRLQVTGLSDLLSAQRESEADSLVLSLAQELRAGLRDFDVLARTAPDSFEILLPEPDAEISALLGPLARRAREALRREAETPSPIDPSRLQLEFGYALYPDEGRTASALKSRAREARIRSL